MSFYQSYVQQVNQAAANVEVSTDSNSLNAEQGMRRWCDMTIQLRDNGHTMHFIGNGASASMASHMSADACKNGELRSSCFNEISLLTAIANDVSYEEAFAVPIRRFGKPGDILIAISSSGNSPNIIAAINAARDLDMHVITLSGMSPDNRARQGGHLNFYVPAQDYGVVESSHQVILHSWLDQYLTESKATRSRWK